VRRVDVDELQGDFLRVDSRARVAFGEVVPVDVVRGRGELGDALVRDEVLVRTVGERPDGARLAEAEVALKRRNDESGRRVVAKIGVRKRISVAATFLSTSSKRAAPCSRSSIDFRATYAVPLTSMRPIIAT
jgi:hypothetical protein